MYKSNKANTNISVHNLLCANACTRCILICISFKMLTTYKKAMLAVKHMYMYYYINLHICHR